MPREGAITFRDIVGKLQASAQRVGQQLATEILQIVILSGPPQIVAQPIHAVAFRAVREANVDVDRPARQVEGRSQRLKGEATLQSTEPTDFLQAISLLVTLDYPDALTGGLRRTTDSTRGILEKTRGDLTLALRQEALEGEVDPTAEVALHGPSRDADGGRDDREDQPELDRDAEAIN